MSITGLTEPIPGNHAGLAPIWCKCAPRAAAMSSPGQFWCKSAPYPAATPPPGQIWCKSAPHAAVTAFSKPNLVQICTISGRHPSPGQIWCKSAPYPAATLLQAKSGANLHHIRPPRLLRAKSGAYLHHIRPPRLLRAKSGAYLHHIRPPRLLRAKSGAYLHHIRPLRLLRAKSGANLHHIRPLRLLQAKSGANLHHIRPPRLLRVNQMTQRPRAAAIEWNIASTRSVGPGMRGKRHRKKASSTPRPRSMRNVALSFALRETEEEVDIFADAGSGDLLADDEHLGVPPEDSSGKPLLQLGHRLRDRLPLRRAHHRPLIARRAAGLSQLAASPCPGDEHLDRELDGVLPGPVNLRRGHQSQVVHFHPVPASGKGQTRQGEAGHQEPCAVPGD